jgi:hypothetical protein
MLLDLILPPGQELGHTDLSLSRKAFYVLPRSMTPHVGSTVLSVRFFPTASFSTISSLLTLFSKFFSSFLHSTCSLSVSHRYLALGGVYLPFWAAVPNNPTLRRRPFVRIDTIHGVFTLFDSSFHSNYASFPSSGRHFTLQLGNLSAPDFNFELLPLRSPLLGQSLLISLPPLTDMLKFSGLSCLISDSCGEILISRENHSSANEFT